MNERTRSLLVNLLATTLVLVVLTACSAPQPPAGPATLTVEPAAGPPGTLITIAGLPATALEHDDLVLLVGGVQMPMLVGEDGGLSSMLPPFVGANGWHEPAGPVDVVVERDTPSRPRLGVAAGAVTVTALAPAPDAHARIVSAVEQMVDAVEVIAANLPTDTDEDDQVMWSVGTAMREFLLTGENSLHAMADGTAPVLDVFEGEMGLELGMALVAAAQLPEMIEELAAGMTELANAMAPPVTLAGISRQSNVLCPYASAPDEDLACKMQLYVVAKRIGDEILGPTAQSYGEVMAVVGIAGIAVRIPYASMVGTVLSLSNLVWSKVLVALMPAKIDAFELSFDDGDIVKQGDRLEGRLELTASNDPPAITSTDLLGLMWSVSGGIPGPNVRSLPGGQQEALLTFAVNTINYFLGILQSAFSAYADAHPELNLSFDLTGIPSKTWGPTVISDYRLFDAHSFTPDLLAVDDETPANPAWRAAEDTSDYARVNVRTATGDQARKIIWSGYQGGAFGDEQAATETVQVCVDGAPNLVGVTSIHPTSFTAEVVTEFTFTLEWEDLCDNVERLYARFQLGGNSPQSVTYDVNTSPNVAGFRGNEGDGVLIETVWVGCSEEGKQPWNITFSLGDSFAQESEERSAFAIVDYGSCP